jgi:deoxyribose-phosphate aldolase
MQLTRQQLAKMIDHTIIKPTATKPEVTKFCQEAKKHGFATVVVNPYHITLAHEKLKGTDVKTCSTIGFPIGATLAGIKAQETQKAVELGAQELDMVINISALKSKDYQTVKNDIQAVVDTAKNQDKNTVVKVIIETGFLTDPEKILACKLVKQAKADYVKTSTGLFSGGATESDIKLMRQTVGKKMGVKAAGGIRTLKTALAMIQAGANRIGTSTAIQIIQEIK